MFSLTEWLKAVFCCCVTGCDTRCSTSDTPYKYFMTVSPLDGKLYVSDYQTLRILRVKTMGPVRDLTRNYEVVAGNGDQCVPGDPHQCGDGRPATQAKLYYPKGQTRFLHGIL